MMTKRILLFVFLCLMFIGVRTEVVMGQQSITVEVKPQIKKYINGHSALQREKYFNLAADSREIVSKTTNEQFSRYLNDYEMTDGRRLGMVYSETRWGN